MAEVKKETSQGEREGLKGDKKQKVSRRKRLRECAFRKKKARGAQKKMKIAGKGAGGGVEEKKVRRGKRPTPFLGMAGGGQGKGKSGLGE